MKTRMLRLPLLGLFFLAGIAASAFAHDEPTSFIDLRLTSAAIEVSATASVTDLAHDLPGLEPAMLLQPATLVARRADISALVLNRMKFTGDGSPLKLELQDILAVPEKRDLHLIYSATWSAAPDTLRADALLFPYDPRHRTFINVYSGGKILRQETLTSAIPSIDFPSHRQQGLGTLFAEFVRLGIHHIVIGFDHILFVIGLLLLGGGMKSLLKIITAFTVAHSITLALATFRVLTPPASIIEPVIALSIVFVGLHAFFGKKTHDPRLVFAFCFGLVHGFGFANVLQGMVLPRQAMGISLFAFNIGVEIAQASIVILVAPVLAFLRRENAGLSEAVIATGALSITAAGAFWFFQRIIG